MPMWRLVMDHHPKTGAANPTNHAGSTTINPNRTVNGVTPNTESGSKHTVDKVTPPMNRPQR